MATLKLLHCYLFSNLSFLSFNSSWYSWIIRSLVNGKLVGIHFQTIFERKPSKHVWRQGLSPFGKKLKKKETGREENKIPRSQTQVSFWLRGFSENRTSIWLVWSSVFTLWTLSSISLSRHHGRNYPLPPLPGVPPPPPPREKKTNNNKDILGETKNKLRW